MKDVAIFEKISLDEYLDDIRRIYPFHDWSLPKEIEEIYKNIRLPQRMKETTGSYYFYTPFDFTLTPGTTVLIPTGIKCKILKEDVSLFIFPDEKAVRTSITLSNGVQIVNAEDYDNEDGQIYIYLEFPCNWNDGYPRTTLFGTQLEKVNQPIHYIAGDAIAQASFLEFGVVENDVPIVEDEEEEEGGGEGNNSGNDSGNTNPGGKENITDDEINDLLDDDTTENGTDDPTPNTGDDNNNTEEPGGENTDLNQNENPDEPTGNTDPDPNEPSGDNPTDPVDPDPTDPNEGTDTPIEPDPVEPTTGDNTDDPVDPEPSTTEPVTEP